MLCDVTAHNLHTASETPVNLKATYKSATSVLLQWEYDSRINTRYKYVVYLKQSQSQGGENLHIVSFILDSHRENMYGYLLTAIPITRVVYTISIVAQLQPHSLPSPVVGPVFPSMCV